jgi:hypothetical protein
VKTHGTFKPTWQTAYHTRSPLVDIWLGWTSDMSTVGKRRNRFKDNTVLIKKYKISHGCKRCKLYSSDPAEFRFLELNLPKARHLSVLAQTMRADYLIEEMEKRDLFCRKCHRLMRREVTRNIAAPPVKPFQYK